jgi:hypothetical protein
MKNRRVVVTLEIETARSLTDLRSKKWWQEFFYETGFESERILQAQANAIKPKKGKK